MGVPPCALTVRTAKPCPLLDLEQGVALQLGTEHARPHDMHCDVSGTQDRKKANDKVGTLVACKKTPMSALGGRLALQGHANRQGGVPQRSTGACWSKVSTC